ncbi:MAG: ATP-binding cassette domain-containing protein, partial [candidate division Zixibacteria bacterium]|nr:ATP-binding cassette domain-containing protein [candidate division Zixibacteria bacterium]
MPYDGACKEDVVNSQNTDSVIEARGVTKEYADNGVPVKAVRGVDLTVQRGEFTAVVGPSGSGKTTFLNIISGLDDATDGDVRLNGKLLSKMTGRELSEFRRDNIGFIFQAYNLIPVLSVQENAEYILLLQGVPAAERHRRVADVLGDLGLEGYANRRPTTLSGGQQQRVAIARAIVSQPSIVLADEPTANLDSETAIGLIDMMRRL